MRTALVSAVLLASLAGSAAADTKTSRSAQVSIDVPDDWKLSGKDDVLLIIADPTDEVGALFWVVDQGDLEKATKLLEAEIGKYVTDARWAGKASPAEVNGLKGIGMKGAAKVQGKPVKTMLLVLGTPNGKALIVLAMVQADKFAAHEGQVKALFGSLRPAK